MKKPDEIKKGLNTCALDLNCNSCPYKGFRCTVNLMQDAAEALQQKDDEKLAMQRRIDNLQQHIDRLHGALNESERKNAKLTVELEAVKRERDALSHIPAVDAVEVVRCEKCAHKREENGVLRCQYSTVDLNPHGYCHRGVIGSNGTRSD